MEDIHHIHWLLYYRKHSCGGCKRDPIGELRPSSDTHRAFSDIYKHSVCMHCKDMTIKTHIHYDCISHTKRRLYCQQCIVFRAGVIDAAVTAMVVPVREKWRWLEFITTYARVPSDPSSKQATVLLEFFFIENAFEAYSRVRARQPVSCKASIVNFVDCIIRLLRHFRWSRKVP